MTADARQCALVPSAAVYPSRFKERVLQTPNDLLAAGFEEHRFRNFFNAVSRRGPGPRGQLLSPQPSSQERADGALLLLPPGKDWGLLPACGD